MYSVVPVGAGVLVALACLFVAMRYLRRKQLIDDLPTSKTQGVFIGLTELKGTAESETPLTSYLAEVPCVQYTWRVEERWSRTVTETYRDAQGHTQTRTRTESGSTTVASGGQSAPFYLKDDTGVIRIVPERAKIEGVRTFHETVVPRTICTLGRGHKKRWQILTTAAIFRKQLFPFILSCT